jgi:small GTP-binding protein
MNPKQERKTLRIVVCGDQEVGKTTLTNIITHTRELFDYYTPTIGVEYKTRYIFDRDIKLAFWDLSGDKRFEKITYPYVSMDCLVIFVYDVNKLESAKRIIDLHEKYRKTGWSGKAIVVGNILETKNQCANYNIGYGQNFANSFGYTFFLVDIDQKTGIQDLETSIFKILELDKENKIRAEKYVKEKAKKNFQQQVVDCICLKKCSIM